nr:hypothetical protein [uncultured Lachnoclostridium sp.]
MEYFRYEIQKGNYINRCMISELKQIEYRSNPAPYPKTCHVNQLWSDIISPTRTQFLKEDIFKNELPEFLECKNIYFPFEAEKIEYSAFWMEPHNVYFGAQINLDVPEPAAYPFIISTCGAVKVFVNGVMQAEMYSYLRDQERSTQIELKLNQGKNEIYILANDLAERDTQFYFKLQYIGEILLEGYLPAQTNLDKLNRIRKIFSEMYLNKFNYQDNNIEINFAKPLQEEFEVKIKLVFADAHTRTSERSKTVNLSVNDTKVSIGDLIYAKVGMVNVIVSTNVGDVSLNKKFDFEYYDTTIIPNENLGTISLRKKAALSFIANYGTNNFQKTLALMETGCDVALADQIIEEELEKINKRYDCSDFRTPALIYAYNSSKFSVEQKDKIKQTLLRFRYWFDEDGNDVMWFFSENHALNFHVSELLAGELFPDEVFANSGMTGLEHQTKAKRLLLAWFENFFAYGFNEWNSAVYIPIDMIAFFALYDMTKDEELRKLAQRALDKTFAIFAANSYQGVVAASYGRIYLKNLLGRRTSESTAINFIASGEGFFNHHCFATTLFALSSYEPSDEIMKLYHVNPEGKEVHSVEGEERVSLSSFKTKDYIIGTVQNYKPGQPGTQEHVLQVMIKDCDTQIWINHPGEATYFGEGRPSYFAGNGTLPLVEQNRNYVKVTFDLLNQEVLYTHAFCPLAQFDEYQQIENWIFLKKKNVYVAINAQNGIQITKLGALSNYELVSPGIHNVWQLYIDDDKTHNCFEDFIAYVKNNYQ